MSSKQSQFESYSKPILRFPYFNDPWDERNLSDVGYFKNGINKSKGDFGFGYPFINLMDVFGKSTISNLKLSLVNANSQELKLYDLKKGDVLFIRSSVKREGVGETSLILEDLENTVYSGFLIRFRDEKIKLDLLFKKYVFASKIFRKKLISLSTTSANTNINQESLSSLKIRIPSISEQQKIAVFLSAIDEWIHNLRLQIQKLTEFKKGIMQQIFSQKIRFKDKGGNEFANWEVRKLSQLFEERTERNGKNENELLSIKLNGGVTLQNNSDKKDNSSEDKSNYKIVQVGNIAYNTMRMWQGASGVSRYNGIVSPAYTVIRLIQGNIEFFGYLFKYPRTIFNFYRFSQGLTSDTWNLKFKHLSEVKVNVPTDITEQQKIADYFSSIDILIESKENHISKAEQWKNGLLQKMFI